MNKKILFVFLCVLVVFFVAGCTRQKETVSKLEQVKKNEKIVLGTSADYPPYEFHFLVNGKDTIVGFDISIAEQIAKDLGVKLEIKDMDFDGLLAALSSGNVDMVIAGMTPTAERKKNVDFSQIYYQATHGVLIRKADLSKYGDKAESLKDAVIGVQRGTIQVTIAKSKIKDLTGSGLNDNHPQIKELGKLPDLVMELKNGKVEAVIAEVPVAKAYAEKNTDLIIASYIFTDEEGGSAIAVKKNNTDLLDAINATLTRLVTSGQVEKFVGASALLADQL